jgi:predicted transcriptional regulator
MDLKKQRKFVGMTQHQLASASGVDRWKITFAETDRIKLKVQELEAIKSVIQRRAKVIAAQLAAE